MPEKFNSFFSRENRVLLIFITFTPFCPMYCGHLLTGSWADNNWLMGELWWSWTRPSRILHLHIPRLLKMWWLTYCYLDLHCQKLLYAKRWLSFFNSNSFWSFQEDCMKSLPLMIKKEEDCKILRVRVEVHSHLSQGCENFPVWYSGHDHTPQIICNHRIVAWP